MKDKFAIMIVIGCVAALTFGGCSTSPESLYVAKCSPCHQELEQYMDLKANSYATLDDWTQMVASMQKETDTISDEDVDSIAGYLYERYAD